MRRPRKLSGYDVCKKCCAKFANRRQIAFVLDGALVWVLVVASGFVLGVLIAIGPPSSSRRPRARRWIIWWFFFAITLAMLLAKDGFAGASPGKWLMGVQAVRRDMLAPIGFGASIGRNLPLLLPFAPLVVALQMMKGPRLGDDIAKTKVIWRKYADSPVFTGRPLAAVDEFAPLAGQLPPVHDTANPYQPPRQ